MSIKDDAEELGITVDDQWSDDMIQEAIDANLNEDAEKPKEDDAEEKPKKGGSKKPTPKKDTPKKDTPKKTKKVINNISGVRFKVYGRIVQPGGSHEPTAMDLEDVKGGKRVENAIKKGYLKRG